MERDRQLLITAEGGAGQSALARVDTRELAAIFLGGCLGAVLRAALARSLPVTAGHWPWATFTVNILGALVLGWLITRLQERLPPTMYTRALLATGFCGALTTFSTLMLELLAMIEHSHPLLALSYAGASIIGGLAAVELSTKFARRGGRLG